MSDSFGHCTNIACPTTCQRYVQSSTFCDKCRNCGCEQYNHKLLAVFDSATNSLHWLESSSSNSSSSSNANSNSFNAKRSFESPAEKPKGVITAANSRAAVRHVFNAAPKIHLPKPSTPRVTAFGGRPPPPVFPKRMRGCAAEPKSPVVKGLKLFFMEEGTEHVPESETSRSDLKQRGQYFAEFPYLLDDGSTISQVDFEQKIRESAVGQEFASAYWKYAFYHQLGFTKSKPMEILSDSSDNFPEDPSRWESFLADCNRKPRGYDLIVKPVSPDEEERSFYDGHHDVEEKVEYRLIYPSTSASGGSTTTTTAPLCVSSTDNSISTSSTTATHPVPINISDNAPQQQQVRDDNTTTTVIDISDGGEEEDEGRQPAISKPLQLSSLQYYEFPNEMQDDTKCGVCQEPLQKNVLVYALPCLHIFHLQCLHNAWKVDTRCPLCREQH